MVAYERTRRAHARGNLADGPRFGEAGEENAQPGGLSEQAQELDQFGDVFVLEAWHGQARAFYVNIRTHVVMISRRGPQGKGDSEYPFSGLNSRLITLDDSGQPEQTKAQTWSVESSGGGMVSPAPRKTAAGRSRK